MAFISNSIHKLNNKQHLQSSANSEHMSDNGLAKKSHFFSRNLTSLVQHIAPYRNEASISPQEAKKAHMAGLYSISAYLDDNKKLRDKDLSTPEELQKTFQELTREDAESILKLSDQRLNTPQKLQQNFPRLTNADAQELQQVLEKLNISIYRDPESKEITLAARGTVSKDDIKQDVMTGLGAKGKKFKALEQLRPLLLAGEIKPNLYTGHSLGGGMATAIANMMGDSDSQVMTFDTSKLNIKQSKLGKKMGHSVPKTDYRIHSPLSLGALMKSPGLFNQTDTVRLKPGNHNTHNPLKRLGKNHTPSVIFNKIHNLHTDSNSPINPGLRQHLKASTPEPLKT